MPAKLDTVGSIDATYSVVSCTSTGELHERIYAPHTRPLDQLTHQAVVEWLDYRRAQWPNTANPHLLINRLTAVKTRWPRNKPSPVPANPRTETPYRR